MTILGKCSGVIERGRVLENRALSRDTFILTVKAPGAAAAASPGQFVKLRAWPAPEEGGAPLLDRPFSIHRTEGGERLSVLYRVVGPGTRILSRLAPGDELKVSGPLGRGLDQALSARGLARVYLAAGGIGLAPMALARDWLESASGAGARAFLFYGEREAEFQVEESWLAAWAPDREAAVEDGRGYGRAGLVTAPLAEALRSAPGPVFACGPMPMLAAVAALGAETRVPVFVSVEARMACGLGVCLTCSLPLKAGGRFKACQDGPVIDAGLVDWEGLMGGGR